MLCIAGAILVTVQGKDFYHRQAERAASGVANIDRVEAAERVAENTHEDAIIASFNSGIYGWFSERSVINLDGKVMSREYFERFVEPLRTGSI